MDKKTREELRKIPTDKLLRSIENDLRQAIQDKPAIAVAARKTKKA
jgi:hypothetical protein